MSLIAELAIAAAVVLLVVGSLVALGKRGFFEPDSVNESSQDEREENSASARSEEFSVPFRRRVKAWSGPYKVFVGSLALLVVGVGVATYQVMKTGSPVQQFATREIRVAAIVIAGIAGGVWLKGWFDRQIGRLVVVYELAAQRNLVEVIPYAKSGVRRTNGSVTVPEVDRNRLLGLFWKYKQVGEDRRLRGSDKPLSDIVVHRIPDHGNELPDGEGWTVQTREEGDKTISGATSTADVTYRSPHTLSDEEATSIRERLKRKDAQLDAIKSTNAELTQKLRKMEKKLANEEYATRDALMSDFEQFSETLQSAQQTIEPQPAKNGSGPLANGNGEEASTK